MQWSELVAGSCVDRHRSVYIISQLVMIRLNIIMFDMVDRVCSAVNSVPFD